MLSLAGEPCRALDVGCGEGRFCRMLQERGFETVGIDPTERLLEAAKSRDSAGGYQIAGGENIPFPGESFGLVVSYLTLLDIPDFRQAIHEMVRVLAPGGHILLANCSPMFTSVDYPWDLGPNREKLHVKVDNYMSEHAIRAQWCGIDIWNYHRPLTAYFEAFLTQGMVLDHFREAVAPPDQWAQHPRLADDLRAPNFLVMRWRKPT